jgi:hypothetical protein
MTKHGQRLRELLTAGKEAGYAGHPEFRQNQRTILGEVQAQAGGAESWLEKVRHDLYATAVAAASRTWAVDTRRAGAEVTTVPLRVVSDRQPSSQESTTRSSVQPNPEWLANTFTDLGWAGGRGRPLALPGSWGQRTPWQCWPGPRL